MLNFFQNFLNFRPLCTVCSKDILDVYWSFEFDVQFYHFIKLLDSVMMPSSGQNVVKYQKVYLLCNKNPVLFCGVWEYM